VRRITLPPHPTQRCIEESLSKQENGDDDLLACLCDLFHSISTQRKRCGVHPPRRFVAKLRAENEVFNNQMHQDAHELLNYLLNEMAEILEKRNKAAAKAKAGSADASGAGAQDDADGDGDGGRSSPVAGSENGGASADGEVSSGAGGSGSSSKPYIPKTWIHNIFEGLLTNETRCLACDSVRQRHCMRAAYTTARGEPLLVTALGERGKKAARSGSRLAAAWPTRRSLGLAA
jgi:ubiquitin carboxyl-terminal hydrolase 12/46